MGQGETPSLVAGMAELAHKAAVPVGWGGEYCGHIQTHAVQTTQRASQLRKKHAILAALSSPSSAISLLL